MGLAASQARLLFLTARMSDLELRAEVISNAKIRLAQQSSNASLEYTKELDKKKLQVQNGYSGGSPTYMPATAANLTAFNETSGKERFIENAAGAILVSQAVADAYDQSGGDITQFMARVLPKGFTNSFDNAQYQASLLTNEINAGTITTGTESVDKVKNYLNQIYAGLESKLNNPSLDEKAKQAIYAAESLISRISESIGRDNGNLSSGALALLKALCTGNPDSNGVYDETTKKYFQIGNLPNVFSEIKKTNGGEQFASPEAKYYEDLFNLIQSNGCFTVSEENYNSTDWLENGVRSNTLFLYEPKKQADGSETIENVSWTSGDNTIQEVDDTAETAKAEAKYESTVAEIQVKDKKYDMEMKQVDTEHGATQNEIDSVKKLIDKNIDRAFKIFQA